MTTSGTVGDNEWQQLTTNDNEGYDEWQNKWQQMVKRVTTSDNASLREITNDSKWQWVVKFDNFPFFEKERNLITQSKENCLNYEEDLLNQKQKQAPKKRYLQ